MKIKIFHTKEEIEGVKKITSINDITENCRLFFEIGFNKTIGARVDKNGEIVEKNIFIKTGLFKEIKDVKKMIREDKRMIDIEYISHHNFVIKKINKNEN